MESSEEESVDGPDVRDACCGSLRGSSNAQAFEPSDRRYVVRSMALMLPSLTQQGKPPGAKAPVHSHTEVPGGTWHMDITSPTVDRSQADGPTAARSQQQKGAHRGLTSDIARGPKSAMKRHARRRSLRRLGLGGSRGSPKNLLRVVNGSGTKIPAATWERETVARRYDGACRG